ncbi:MAG: zinc ribbon domain-containing protein [DPANN group archaeon]|nr:zinc ribbon domain-containing protein [DPANN group archaeon]
MVAMYCHKCGKMVEDHWDFCPSCGSSVIKPIKFKRPSSVLPLDNLVDSFKRQFDEINKFMERDLHGLEKDFEVFNLRSEKNPKIIRNGFSVSISSGTGQKPKIDIKTFGDIDKTKLAEEFKKNLGLKGVNINDAIIKSTIPNLPEEQLLNKKIPSVTEEPKTDIKRLSDKIVIDIELPDIESDKNIIVNMLSSSIELKAIGKKKMYFKIMQIPKGWTLISKKFKDRILKLEFQPNS